MNLTSSQWFDRNPKVTRIIKSNNLFKKLKLYHPLPIHTNNSFTQKDLLGFEDAEGEDFAFAKSTRSLNSASSVFSFLVGVNELIERFWVFPTKPS